MEKGITIRPSVTLEQIFGSGHVLISRASSIHSGLLPSDPVSLAFSSGSYLTVASDMPVVCSSTMVTEEGLSLLRLANLEVAPLRYIYDSEREYQSILNNLSRGSQKVIFRYVHSPDELDQRAYSIKPEILRYLNHKSHLDILVPKEYLPQRVTIPGSALPQVSRALHLPTVLKAATNTPNSAGYGVVICRKREDLQDAINRFRSFETVVIEEYMDIKENYCIQYAVDSKGHIIYLGAAEQIVSDHGKYMGNWIDKKMELPKPIIDMGKEIMKTAYSMGFHGVAGFDTVFTEDKRILVIDLNFRLNGSTPALLLRDSIMQALGVSLMKVSSWMTQLAVPHFSKIIREAIKEEFLIPLSIYLPPNSSHSPSSILMKGIVAGSSREEIAQREKQLGNSGILKR